MLNYKFLIPLFLLIFAASCASYSSCTKELKLSDKFSKSQRKLICNNDSIRKTISLYHKDIDDSLMIDVLNKYEEKEYLLNEVVFALELYAKLGPKWHLEKNTHSNYPEFKSIDDYLEFDSNFLQSIDFDSIIHTNKTPMTLTEPKIIKGQDNELNLIFRKTKFPWHLYMQNKETIDVYDENQDWVGLVGFIKKIMVEENLNQNE